MAPTKGYVDGSSPVNDMGSRFFVNREALFRAVESAMRSLAKPEKGEEIPPGKEKGKVPWTTSGPRPARAWPSRVHVQPNDVKAQERRRVCVFFDEPAVDV